MTEADLKAIEHRVLLALLRESADGAFIQEVRFSITDLRALIAEVRRLRCNTLWGGVTGSVTVDHNGDPIP